MKIGMQARLRDVSHACHVRLNRHPLLVGLTDSGYPLSTYHTVLVAYSQLYEELENRISQFTSTHPLPFDYTSRIKLQWLQEDIRYLDKDPKTACLSSPFNIEFPEITNIGELIGVLYPIEGSTLGGQVISRNLQQHLGLSAGMGACFFNGYGEQTKERWGEFCSFADSVGDDAEQCAAAEKATLLTFFKFEEVLDEYHRTAH